MGDVEEARKRSPAVDLDVVLGEIGKFGRHQARTLGLCMVVVVFVAWSAGEYVFTTARIDTRCLIPECESSPPEFATAWPTPADGCSRYGGNGSAAAAVCSDDWFDRTLTHACDAYVYENTDTVVFDYDLGCDEWRRSFIGTIRTFGTLVALPITGWVSDRAGRRVALALNVFNTAWLGVVRYWAGTYWVFAVSEFIEAAFGSGGFTCAYIIMTELVGSEYRVSVGAAINTTFSVGQVTMALIASVVPNWRRLTLALYVPQFLALLLFFYLNESVRWLISKGRYEEATRVLEKVALVNGTSLSESSIAGLKETAEEARRQTATPSAEPWLPVLVFRHRPILLRCLVTPVLWITCILVYYGLSINAVNISGNKYINYAAVSAVEVPGYWTAVLLLDRLGRRPVLVVAYWVCAVCQLTYVFISNESQSVSLVMYLIGKYSISTVMTSIYVYTAELFPTTHRHSLFAYSSMMGRVGAMVAPLTPALGDAIWPQFPFALFAVFAFVSGLLMLLLPETRGTRLPDTMEQASGRRGAGKE